MDARFRRLLPALGLVLVVACKGERVMGPPIADRRPAARVAQGRRPRPRQREQLGRLQQRHLSHRPGGGDRRQVHDPGRHAQPEGRLHDGGLRALRRQVRHARLSARRRRLRRAHGHRQQRPRRDHLHAHGQRADSGRVELVRGRLHLLARPVPEGRERARRRLPDEQPGRVLLRAGPRSAGRRQRQQADDRLRGFGDRARCSRTSCST